MRTMKNLKEQQRQEAIKRIKKLTKQYSLNDDLLNNFENGKICYFHEMPNGNVKIKQLSDNLEYLKMIKDFEKKYDALVYCCILTPAPKIAYYLEGYLLDVLYVGRYKKYWAVERLSKNEWIDTFCFNLKIREYSEFGSFEPDGKNGFLIRL